MLHRRIGLLALLVLFLLSPGIGNEDFRCVHCNQIVERGYTIEGSFYCKQHMYVALPKCSHCEEPIQGTYVQIGHDRRSICKSCRDNLPRCFLCSLPSEKSRGGTTLKDGRKLCSVHADSGVTDPARAKRLFRQATAEIRKTFYGRLSLRQALKEVKLVDLDELIRSSKGSGHGAGLSDGRVLGITTVVFVTQGNEKWLEPATIHLLDNVPPDRMLAVAAHEYAHVWQAENHRDYVHTRPILREGFAEWVAYKVSKDRGRKHLLKIMKNPAAGVYYRGLMKFLELERQQGVQGVLNYAVRANSI